MSTSAGKPHSLAQRSLPGSEFLRARQAYELENYESSLDLVRHCVDHIEDEPRDNRASGENETAIRVCDAVVLWARNLFQLDRYDDFQILLASAGRWGLVPEDLAELDVVRLAFAFKRGDYEEVVQEATRFIDGHRHQLPPVLADFLLLRGHSFSNLGEPEKAQEDAELAYSLFRLLDKKLEGARTANLQGMLKVRASDYDAAERWFRRAYELHQKLGKHKNMGGNRLNLGIVNYKRGDLARAEIEFQAASILLMQVDAQVSLCRTAIARGNNLRLQRDFEGARKVLSQAYQQANQLMLAREEALTLEFLGDVSRDEGKIDQARRYYSRALAIGSSLAPEGDLVMEVLRRQGQCLSLQGRHAEGITVMGRALVLSRRLGDRFEEGIVRRALATALFEMGDLNPAAQHIEQSAQLLNDVGARFESAKTLLVQARIHLACLDGGLVDKPAKVLESAWRCALSSLDPFLKAGVEHWVLQSRTLLQELSKRRARWEKMQREGLPPESLDHGQGMPAATPIIHVSSRMRDLIQLSDAFADSEEPVLITGATGTGKELFARRLHDHSRRRSGELVCVNVTAIPESMFAREFFGHVRGSFSGADRDGIGLAAKADGGTLFLDEIGELPLDLQPRLLRLLQDGTFHAIGDPQERKVNIRLVAATNADLGKMVQEGKFRADLYYRLKILGLSLPAISERREDIMPLMRHFLSGAAGRAAEPTEFFNLESIDLMQSYDWPGNVREIAMVARQARVQMASTGQVCVEVGQLQDNALFFTGPQQAPVPMVAPSLPRSENISRSKILMVLTEVQGNRAEAARRLGVSRSTLYRHLEKMGMAAKSASS